MKNTELWEYLILLAENKISLAETHDLIVKLFDNEEQPVKCPCCGSDKTYHTKAIHCTRCAVTTEI
jgi:hypothetical protein